MKIRDKLLLGFGLYVLLAVILGFFAYKELLTIDKRLLLVEPADDITNTILEVRRYEKNFLLYKAEADFREAKEYLARLVEDIDGIRTEIIAEIGSVSYESMRGDISKFGVLLDGIAGTFAEQERQSALVRNTGRSVERSLAGTRSLQPLLVLRRYEKNVMLYRSQESFDIFRRSYIAS